MNAIRRGLVPLGFVAAVGAIALVMRGIVAPEAALGGVTAVTLGGSTLLELAIGRWRPRLRNFVRDGLFFGIGTALDALGKVVVGSIALSFGAGPGPASSLPLPLALPVGLVVADGAAYAVHWAFHAHPLLWRMHARHHAPDELYAWMSAVNAPLMVLLVRALPFAALTFGGFDPRVVFAYAVLDAVLGLLSHTGVETHNPWLSQIWVTPEIHQLHHSPIHAGNHGLLLTFWDRVFGTYVPAGPDGVSAVGLPQGILERA